MSRGTEVITAREKGCVFSCLTNLISLTRNLRKPAGYRNSAQAELCDSDQQAIAGDLQYAINDPTMNDTLMIHWNRDVTSTSRALTLHRSRSRSPTR
jgi:hypothetical protein